MKYRKLRITCSILCAALCLSLIALRVLSYSSNAFLSKRLATCVLSLQASRGDFGIWTTSLQFAQSSDSTWHFGSSPVLVGVMTHLIQKDEPIPELLGFRYESMPPIGSVLFVPFWAPILPVAAAAALPWIKWRISWRAAISAFCMLVTILLIGLWTRSYKWMDITDRSSAYNVCSMKGKLFIGETFMLTGNDTLNPIASVPASYLGICTLSPKKFELVPLTGGVVFPYWLAVIIVAPLAAVPWLRWRFSIRTMLIATALIAILLCVAIAALRR
jgi:hypothetical protein